MTSPTFKTFFLAFTLALAIGSYAYWIEPNWIEVTHHTLEANVKSPLKIAHLTDLHISKLGYRENRLRELILKESPDTILISGDLVSDTGDYLEVGKFLKELHAPLGIWIVKGNWEHWRPNTSEHRIYSEAGPHFLNNTHTHLKDDYWIIGLDDSYAGQPNLSSAEKGIPEDGYRIGLFHSPDFFTTHAESFNIVLAGHTHGGQIRIPLLPPLWLPLGSGVYVEGWYTSLGTRSKMYVSRGIGNSILNIRFFCRPELPIITIVPAKQE